MSTWTADVADDLFDDTADGAHVAVRALEQLRVRARAAIAAVWAVDDAGHLRLVGASSEHAVQWPDTTLEGEDAHRNMERLRQAGTIVCPAGEVSGLEGLVPLSMESFIVAGATSRGVVRGALVVAWKQPVPPCDERAVGDMQIAASLLVRSLPLPEFFTERSRLHGAILRSISDRIAVVDRDGVIIEVNAAWAEFGRLDSLAPHDANGPGVNYLDVCGRAAANGSPDAAAAREGIAAVCGGTSTLFQAVYPCDSPGGAAWCAMTVTPLQHPSGGAVIVHADLTRENSGHLAQHEGDLLLRRAADAVPLPMWVMSRDGALRYSNERWLQAIAGSPEPREWTIAFHPEDRARAAAALDHACSRREGFSLELRLKAADNRYRWAICLVNPVPTLRGEIESYVGCCCDVSARRRVEAAFNRIASKLVVAQEAERSRIARELHDDIGQRLALVASRLQGALEVPGVSRRTRANIAAARDGLGEIAVTIHNLSHELHPAKIRLLGLVQTLEALCRDIVEETHVDVRFTAEGMLSQVDEDTALCVFRVAQEALRNAVKHSGGRIFYVHLSGTATSLTLRIADDGDGFDPLASQSAGIGLVTMRERVELMGGVLTVETAMARGTMIEIWVPVIHAPADVVKVRAASARGPVRARARATPSASSDRDPV